MRHAIRLDWSTKRCCSVALGLLVAVVIEGCAVNPASGRPELAVISAQKEQG